VLSQVFGIKSLCGHKPEAKGFWDGTWGNERTEGKEN
jgi:hypothetical protein